MPAEVWEQVLAALHDLEQNLDKRFGDPTSPLLLSCRSGAKFSMPGMMDTVLNIGLNDDTAKGLVASPAMRTSSSTPTAELIQMFGTVVLGLRDELFENVLASARTARGVASDADLSVDDLRSVVARFRDIAAQFPIDPTEQLRMAIEAVFASWNGKRAVDYRNAAGIPHDLGTAVNVQAMVFGNLGEHSATGVTMTRSGATGRPGLEGDYLINAQGEDVVSGTRATRSLETLAEAMPQAHADLQRMALRWPTTATCRHRVHCRGRQTLAAADSGRQANSSGRRPHRRGSRQREPHHPAGRLATGHPEPDRLLPPPATGRRRP